MGFIGSLTKHRGFTQIVACVFAVLIMTLLLIVVSRHPRRAAAASSAAGGGMLAMAMLTASRDTEEREGRTVTLPIAAALYIYAGGLIATDANGNAVPASDTAGLRVRGRAEQEVDNTAGAAGDNTVDVKRGVFYLNNSATQANVLTVADRGRICYIEDDNTVARTSVNLIAAGEVVDVDANGVWVDTTKTLPATAPDTVTGKTYKLVMQAGEPKGQEI